MPFIEKNIGVIKNSKILDIGCDNGGWLNEFDKSNKLIGIETSKANIERAKEFFGVEIIPKPWDCGLIKNSSIDLITSMHTFEHFTNPVNALVCANRALKIGGYIHIQVPSPFGLVFRRGLNFAFKPYHLYYFSEKVLSNLLNQTGFKFIDGRELPPLRFNKKSIFDSEYFASGVTEIIFEKIRTVSSREKGYYPINNHHDELMDHLKLSEKYDLKFIKIYELRNMPFLGLFIKILHKIGTRLFTSNRSKKNLVNQAISSWK